MVARNPARYLAPIALAATIVGAYLIVEHHVHKAPSAVAGTKAQLPTTRRRKFAKAKFYTVRPGDSLSTISARTGIPLPTLESLNQSVDPNTLQAGQRLRLRR